MLEQELAADRAMRSAERADALRVISEDWPFTWTPPGRDPRSLAPHHRQMIATTLGRDGWGL